LGDRSRVLRAFVVAAALGLSSTPSLSPTASAEQADEPSNLPRVVLGTVSGKPGDTLSIPLFHQSEPDQGVRQLRLEVEYAANRVQFVKAEKGPASKTQDFNLIAEGKPISPADTPAERGRLTIDISASPDGKASLPVGFLAALEFQVSADTSAGSVRLGPITGSAVDGTNNALKVVAEEGAIVVAPPVLACFFYMH
jgi:hypothetical protein